MATPAMFNIVLVHPEIPPNTGNVIRLAANTGCALHLIEPLGFSMDHRLLRRAGLDYHEYTAVQRHHSFQAWLQSAQPDPTRCFAFTTRGHMGFAAVKWQAGDWLCCLLCCALLCCAVLCCALLCCALLCYDVLCCCLLWERTVKPPPRTG